MKKLLLVTIFTFLLFSCDRDNNATARKEFFNQSFFESSIIQNLSLYDSLKAVILLNIDTIFKFRNSKNIITYIENDSTSEKIEDSDSYSFRDNQNYPEQVRLENMPEFIYPIVKDLFMQLGNDKINGFTLWTDSTIEIEVKDIYKPEINLDGAHTLIWKRTYTHDSASLIRDTVIAPGWTYQIWVGEHEGR